MSQKHQSIVTLRGDIMDIKPATINGKTKVSFRLVIFKEMRSNNETKLNRSTWNCEAWGNAGQALMNIQNMHTVSVDGEFQNYSYDGQDGQKKYGTRFSVIGFGGDCGLSMYAAEHQKLQQGQHQGQQQGYNQGYQQNGAPPPNFGMGGQQQQYPPQYGQQQYHPQSGGGYAGPNQAPPPQQRQAPPPHNYAPGASNPPPQQAQNFQPPPAFDSSESIPF